MEKGFEGRSNYQRQNAFWFLAVAVTSLAAFIAHWDAYVNIAVVSVFCLFLILSAANHTWSMKNVIRPVLTALLTAAFWHPVTGVLFK